MDISRKIDGLVSVWAGGRCVCECERSKWEANLFDITAAAVAKHNFSLISFCVCNFVILAHTRTQCLLLTLAPLSVPPIAALPNISLCANISSRVFFFLPCVLGCCACVHALEPLTRAIYVRNFRLPFSSHTQLNRQTKATATGGGGGSDGGKRANMRLSLVWRCEQQHNTKKITRNKLHNRCKREKPSAPVGLYWSRHNIFRQHIHTHTETDESALSWSTAVSL